MASSPLANMSDSQLMEVLRVLEAKDCLSGPEECLADATLAEINRRLYAVQEEAHWTA